MRGAAIFGGLERRREVSMTRNSTILRGKTRIYARFASVHGTMQRELERVQKIKPRRFAST